MLYNSAAPYSTQAAGAESGRGWISRYAWGRDYHDVLRERLEGLAGLLRAECGEFEYRVCVDTAPLLERSLARMAGLGWIGKNTCLINQKQGSWFFLGELLTSLELEPDHPPADRCGSCLRCIEACPTDAIVPRPDGGWTIDSRLCISYLTIEKKGTVPDSLKEGMGRHVFGCDICQDVCPWNRRAPGDCDPAYEPGGGMLEPELIELAGLSEAEFRARFRSTPVWRTKYRGFLRNVAVAMGNAPSEAFVPALERLLEIEDEVVREPARWALARVRSGGV